ncbi:unnamed protein product [Vicia faba]|uniref:Uncharacterized protein n=1 Tax=Vicia faba TaxID=3906 RepID=A0AAV1AZP2_VICFA|nr:unnamed protein product [Vicia faba]
MAQRAYSFSALLLIFNILLVTNWQAVAGRNIAKNSDNDDKKEPQFLFKHDHGSGSGTESGSGSGSGSGTESGSGSTGHSYVPGGDDTSIPNPGNEVPIPGSGGVGAGNP